MAFQLVAANQRLAVDGIGLALKRGMSTALELVFKYRQLVGNCDAGAGMNLDDIEALSAIESLFPNAGSPIDRPSWQTRLGVESVSLTALLRGNRVCDHVEVVSMGPEGMICVGAPYMTEGDRIEIVFDDEELRVSYRFAAVVEHAIEMNDDGELRVEFRFTGVPLLLRFAEQRTRPDTHETDIAEGTPIPQGILTDRKVS